VDEERLPEAVQARHTVLENRRRRDRIIKTLNDCLDETKYVPTKPSNGDSNTRWGFMSFLFMKPAEKFFFTSHSCHVPTVPKETVFGSSSKSNIGSTP